MEKGIAIAGTIAVDYIKTIDQYPEKGMLGNILSSSRGVGGCVTNTLCDLAKMDPTIPLYAYGGIGDDENGDFVVRVLKEHDINTDGIVRFPGEMTAFTDVMTLVATGERTFFNAKGANKIYSYSDLDFDSLEVDLFHIGYAFLMDPFDREDEEYGTVMARALARVQSMGIRTSMDLVSVENERYSEIVKPSLRYCNYFIVNEIEAGKTVNLSPYGPDGSIDEVRIRKICELILEAGVKDMVVIHAPLGGWAMTNTGEFYFAPSLKLPQNYIKGTVGAGDAFCAGMLYGIYKEMPVKEALEIACMTAACSLSEYDSISGMKTIDEIKSIYGKFRV
ncbi:sugar/nucleoside kinase (ribokinase family) [Herbinix hemicellulosilytica]|uniref:Carbohydrate kinase PfkB domain-containing protein n=1 Tax=Herbinix hemicellulosilytica TaxID=1564487 RepID=A0A0H5SUU9_HERHM|nr:carbohydrate kinase family protein [Herbinix hemicellulosilytica]RBP58361.1 sugar/nucleoside kinase (ribokinase family) [Herbinix hemicellulosilytica]CRZ34078.1 hypothetical protein HHT355_0875 [Herbinix hemicellulosilytica]